MDAETEAAIERLTDRLEAVARDVAERVRWLSMHHEREWKDAAAWRTQWSAELDALEIEVALLKTAVETLERESATAMTVPGSDQRSQNERIREAVQAASDAFVEVLFDLLPPDRMPLKVRFQKTLGNLWAEVLGGATTMAAGTVVALDQRITALEEKQVGDDAGR
jgi:hypothetical protein